LPRPELMELAKARGGQIIVPTGALMGLDAVTAAAEGRIHSVRMITRKPPGGLAGAPYLEANGISVEGLNEPKRVFLQQKEDLFVAKQGDIVKSRYKVVQIANTSVTIEDVLYSNRQTIPLTPK